MPRTRPPYPEEFRREAVDWSVAAAGRSTRSGRISGQRPIAEYLGQASRRRRRARTRPDDGGPRGAATSAGEPNSPRRAGNPKKSGGLLRQGARAEPVAAIRFIAAEKAHHSIKVMCRVLGVSRAGFYAWERRAPSDRDLADAWLTEKIRRSTPPRKGPTARGVYADLRLAHGVEVNHKRVERLMASNGLSGLPGRRRRRTTIRVEGVRVAPDLLEPFNPTAPNRTWSADITYTAHGRPCSIRARRRPLLPASWGGR